MQDAAVLEEIRNELSFIKEKITVIEVSISEIDADLHRKFNPEYAKELDRIEKEDKRIHFKNMGEFDKHLNI